MELERKVSERLWLGSDRDGDMGMPFDGLCLLCEINSKAWLRGENEGKRVIKS